ncbi:lipopolysaccharide assembly LapA domain-containing protein [Leeia sp.]|uniref:LapA family protein n=1 Tax=Leeia sp. TaxID=2884678 RepID=UPI0035B4F1E2
MRYVFLLLKITLFILLLAFAMKNGQTVSLNLFQGHAWQTPLVVLLLVFFAVGTLFGLLASMVFVMRVRRELLSLKRELRNRNAAASPLTQPASDAVL